MKLLWKSRRSVGVSGRRPPLLMPSESRWQRRSTPSCIAWAFLRKCCTIWGEGAASASASSSPLVSVFYSLSLCHISRGPLAATVEYATDKFQDQLRFNMLKANLLKDLKHQFLHCPVKAVVDLKDSCMEGIHASSKEISSLQMLTGRRSGRGLALRMHQICARICALCGSRNRCQNKGDDEWSLGIASFASPVQHPQGATHAAPSYACACLPAVLLAGRDYRPWHGWALHYAKARG